jgi:hypothetical protein
MPALLRPHRGSATKIIGANGVLRDYAAGVTFVGWNIVIPPDVATQADWLRIQVRRDEFYIAGDIRDGAADMKTMVNRRYRELSGEPAPDIRDVLQTHLFVDCDGVPGSCDFRADPLVAVISVRDMVPELKGVACVFVGSSQAGLSERVRGKYLFRLAAPKSMAALRAWAEDVNRKVGAKIADPALYNPVQPVYLAAPRFVDGALDPMPARVLVLPGDERPIVLPEPVSPPSASLALTPASPIGPVSKLLDGVACDWDELTAGVNVFDFDAFADAVMFLTDKGWFDKGQHDAMLRLAFACADVTAKGAADADAVRELYFWVVEKTGRDAADNEARYDDALRRAQGLTHGPAKIVTPGTIFHWAREQGWAGLAAALSPAASSSSSAPGWTAAHEARLSSAAVTEALKDAKSRLHNAFKAAQILGQPRIRLSLVHVALTVSNVTVRSRLMFALAALLLKSNHSPEEIVGAVIACGFPRETGAHAVLWARKNIAKGDRSP